MAAPIPVRPTRLTIIENERAALWYYPGLKIVHQQFHAFDPGTNHYSHYSVASIDRASSRRRTCSLSTQRC